MCGKEVLAPEKSNVKLGAFHPAIPDGCDDLQECWYVCRRDICSDCVIRIEEFIDNYKKAAQS
jgi:hypothetical protein